MDLDELFMALDLDGDGSLTREELSEAARRLGWGWNQAPVMAVLDRLLIRVPMIREEFVEVMDQIIKDRAGPYGEVLLRSNVPARTPEPSKPGDKDALTKTESQPVEGDDLVSLFRNDVDPAVADEYAALLGSLDPIDESLDGSKTAMIIIDPQRAFTEGVWMRSIGPAGESEVMPIRLAFEKCGRMLQRIEGRVETLFSRCPFPPGSYDWDERVSDRIDAGQLYFVKPGNSILWPPTNGSADWVDGLLDRGKTVLVMGGCTLNSCVRVSAVEIQRRFSDRGLQVVVGLPLCGGRTSNYVKSAEFKGMSSVEAAVREMESAKVRVVPDLKWR
jgi:nicotinamidase-related amidase